MTLIEKYQAAKEVAKRVRGQATNATGRDNPRNDKARIECRFVELAQARFTPAVLHFEAMHGYYGDSACYSDMSGDTARYVARAITEMGKAIMDRAAVLAETDAETARLAAAEEARAVLEGVA